MSDRQEQASSRTGQKSTAGPSRRNFLKGTGALVAAGAFGSHEVGAHGDYPKRVVGYYPYWASSFGPADIPYDKITHLNYAFLNPQSDGTVVLADPSHDSIITDLASYDDENTVFQFSISGGWYPQEYSDAAATAANRSRFAQTAVDHVVNYGFDGIDVDWEYPDGTTRASDPENFALLIEAVRNELDSRVGTWAHLTIAGSANPNTVNSAYKDRIFQHLNHVNVMTYDYHGDWSNDTNFNAPFDSPPDDPDGQQNWSVSHSMNHWASRPVANSKLVMGIPFYGRSFSGVSSTNDGLFNSFSSSSSETYYNIQQNIKPQSDYEYHWHSGAKVPWLYSAVEGTFISYDNESSISNKCNFVNNNGFGGVMCWELSQDASNTLITTMHESVHGSQTSTKFDPGDRTVTTSSLSVRDGAGTSNTRIDTAPQGTTGSVTDGPVNSDGYTWYEIAYDDGIADGWSAANWLEATRFKMNDRAVTTDYLWVRDGPGTSYTHIDDAPSGTEGTIVDGPIDSDGYTWWKVDYDGGVSTGWAAQGTDWLVQA